MTWDHQQRAAGEHLEIGDLTNDVDHDERGIRSAKATLSLATRGQLRELAIALNQFGLTERGECLGYCSAIAGRPITSRKELGTREVSAILDHLEHHIPSRLARR